MGIDKGSGVDVTCTTLNYPDGRVEVVSFEKRYANPPPPGTEPDKDYEPKDGDWFWWFYTGDGQWGLLQRKGEDVYNEDGKYARAATFRGRCLPAVAPE